MKVKTQLLPNSNLCALSFLLLLIQHCGLVSSSYTIARLCSGCVFVTFSLKCLLDLFHSISIHWGRWGYGITYDSHCDKTIDLAQEAMKCKEIPVRKKKSDNKWLKRQKALYLNFLTNIEKVIYNLHRTKSYAPWSFRKLLCHRAG